MSSEFLLGVGTVVQAFLSILLAQYYVRGAILKMEQVTLGRIE